MKTKITKLQKQIYDFLKQNPQGVIGAVRVNQLARGLDPFSIGSGSCLEPLYRLINKGLVRTESTGKYCYGKPILKYFAV